MAVTVREEEGGVAITPVKNTNCKAWVQIIAALLRQNAYFVMLLDFSF